MKYKNLISQITKSGFLMAIGIILSFLTFKFATGNIFLIAIPIFLMPCFLKMPFYLITTVLTVIFSDLINGWILFTWISIIAYIVGVLIIGIGIKILKQKWFYNLVIIFASLAISLIYFLLEWLIFEKTIAYNDLIATLIQFGITIPIVMIIYLPLQISNKINYFL